MVIGNNAEPTEIDKHLADLAFICTDANGFSVERYEYYKGQLLKQYASEDSNDDIIVEAEKEDLAIPVEPPSSPASGSGPMNSS